MKQNIGNSIARHRKALGLTQDDLAKKLHISNQAVSKWETGVTTPDVYLLPKIAAILNISIDKLLAYSHNFESSNFYDSCYSQNEYYWGVKPNNLCLDILRLCPPTKPLKVLDIGCGEGRDAVFLARCGYSVTAFDISDAGIDKTRRLSDRAGVFVDVFKADINDFRLEHKYDILFSSGVLQYIAPSLRNEIIDNYRAFTAKGGFHAFLCMVNKPFISAAPDEDSLYTWKTAELFSFYHDWYIHNCSEIVFNCNSAGIPHKHAANILVAENI